MKEYNRTFTFNLDPKSIKEACEDLQKRIDSEFSDKEPILRDSVVYKSGKINVLHDFKFGVDIS